jgi:hypothetical protein
VPTHALSTGLILYVPLDARWSLGAKIRALGHCVFMSSKLPLLNACIEKTINPERPGLQVSCVRVCMHVAAPYFLLLARVALYSASTNDAEHLIFGARQVHGTRATRSIPNPCVYASSLVAACCTSIKQCPPCRPLRVLYPVLPPRTSPSI